MTEIKNEQTKDLTPSRGLIGRAKAVDRIWTVVFYLVALFFLLLLFAFAGYVIIKGFAGATPEMFRFDRNGIGNYFFNTIYLVFLSLLISVPIGVMGGIYMAEYAKDNAFTKFLRIAIETLSSLPSIVVGLFGYLIFLVATHSQPSLLAGSICVAILSLPLMTTTTEDALRSLPPSYKLGSLGMGATLRQTIQSVLIPACVPRIITGVILAAGRGFGEAAALLYTSGSDTNIKSLSENLVLLHGVRRRGGCCQPECGDSDDSGAVLLPACALPGGENPEEDGRYQVSLWEDKKR